MPDRPFPDTRPSIVLDAVANDEARRARARDAIAAAYWEPIRAWCQYRWQMDADTAADATQDFFAQALERDLLHRYDPTRARLRSYLRLCVDSHVRNAFKASSRLRRGGDQSIVDLDLVADTVATDEEAQDAWFEREWMRALFADALAALRLECEQAGKAIQWAVFHRLEIEEADQPRRSSYAELAQAFAIPVTQVTNYLAWTRRRLRLLVLERLRAQCGSDEEYRAETQRVFGVSP